MTNNSNNNNGPAEEPPQFINERINERGYRGEIQGMRYESGNIQDVIREALSRLNDPVVAQRGRTKQRNTGNAKIQKGAFTDMDFDCPCGWSLSGRDRRRQIRMMKLHAKYCDVANTPQRTVLNHSTRDQIMSR